MGNLYVYPGLASNNIWFDLTHNKDVDLLVQLGKNSKSFLHQQFNKIYLQVRGTSLQNKKQCARILAKISRCPFVCGLIKKSPRAIHISFNRLHFHPTFVCSGHICLQSSSFWPRYSEIPLDILLSLPEMSRSRVKLLVISQLSPLYCQQIESK